MPLYVCARRKLLERARYAASTPLTHSVFPDRYLQNWSHLGLSVDKYNILMSMVMAHLDPSNDTADRVGANYVNADVVGHSLDIEKRMAEVEFEGKLWASKFNWDQGMPLLAFNPHVDITLYKGVGHTRSKFRKIEGAELTLAELNVVLDIQPFDLRKPTPIDAEEKGATFLELNVVLDIQPALDIDVEENGAACFELNVSLEIQPALDPTLRRSSRLKTKQAAPQPKQAAPQPKQAAPQPARRSKRIQAMQSSKEKLRSSGTQIQKKKKNF
jgi:hypothetical protein